MALSTFITLGFISFCVVVHGSTTFSFQRHLDNGDSVIYVRGLGTKDGQAYSYSTMRHPSRDDFQMIITKATDGRDTVVKNVYDSNGQMVDCDVSFNEDETRQFLDEVDTEMQIYVKHHGPQSQTIDLPRGRPAMDLRTSVQVQGARCENFLQAVADENGQKQRVPVELDEVEHEQAEDDGKEKRRQKRAYLIWPGTNWCGKGSKAEFAQSYGEHAEADQCCQKHDQCPYIIEGFTTKFNYFNFRIHTLSICDCDEKFMHCLKAANESTATMVGKVFFNVVNTECFDLKLQKTCSKRSWWGGCEKYTTKWTASIRSLGNYPE